METHKKKKTFELPGDRRIVDSAQSLCHYRIVIQVEPYDRGIEKFDARTIYIMATTSHILCAFPGMTEMMRAPGLQGFHSILACNGVILYKTMDRLMLLLMTVANATTTIEMIIKLSGES